jgi:hypothetical protein
VGVALGVTVGFGATVVPGVALGAPVVGTALGAGE